MNVNFEIAALFPSPFSQVKKGGNFKTNIHLDSVELFLYHLSSSEKLLPSQINIILTEKSCIFKRPNIILDRVNISNFGRFSLFKIISNSFFLPLFQFLNSAQSKIVGVNLAASQTVKLPFLLSYLKANLTTTQ